MSLVSRDPRAIDQSMLVTKRELNAELDLLRAEIRLREAEARYRILRWGVAAAMGAQTIVIVGAIIALTKGLH